MKTNNKTTWVVVVTEKDEAGEVLSCSIVSEEYETEHEADDFAGYVSFHNPSFEVEVGTLEDALAVVSD